MWPMKCPPLISRSLRAPPSDHSRPVSKVVVSIDNDDSPPRICTVDSYEGLGSSSSMDSFASWKMNGSRMEKEEREEMPLQGEDESRR
ncbi:hypothetical protein D0Y65_046239 [Glycine soja]|uniref:Uncharacterized protein n=1 Tax=Glycine soja TaxID=3848 RepID=A0A445G8L0_GLYSO|nr:hypothetical protein D0Y65_046239 [Glycine soja]